MQSGTPTKCSSLVHRMRRIFAISDLHVDYKENREFINSWTRQQYGEDILLVAGDVTDGMSLLKDTLQQLRQTFYKVFYVTGNHEMWIRSKEEFKDSIVKFHEIVSLCESIDIQTKPEKIALSDTEHVWVCPLFSWYSYPEDENSLYVKPNNPKADQNAKSMWMDNHLCIWPDLDLSVSKYFENFNSQFVPKTFDSPVVSFSHFLPRQDLIFENGDEKSKQQLEKERLGIAASAGENSVLFNFSMYAGCKGIENQIRAIKSVAHVHGHQHRQRDRTIDGVRYVSHCLGYKRERDAGFMWGIHEWNGPKLVWPAELQAHA